MTATANTTPPRMPTIKPGKHKHTFYILYTLKHSISEQYNTYYETSVHFNVYMGRVTTKSVQLIKE